MKNSWNQADLDFVRNNAHLLLDREIAARLSAVTGNPVTEAGVRHIRKVLGIKKRPGRGVCEVVRPRD